MRIAVALLCTAACSSRAYTAAESETQPAPPSFGENPPLASSPTDGGGAGTATSLTAIVRDFAKWNAGDPTTVPDFENYPHIDPKTGAVDPRYDGDEDDRGIVAGALGADGKPVYAKPSTMTTHGKDFFDLWYRDTPGRNIHVEVPLPLTANADGSYAYGSEGFFPIDDGTPYATKLGNQGDAHNYSFTVEIHTIFTYRGGEYFDFRGDDDVFVFVDGKLVIDLGGIHGPEPARVTLDELGLVKGEPYPLDFFSAERHKTGSNILFSTTLDLRAAPIR